MSVVQPMLSLWDDDDDDLATGAPVRPAPPVRPAHESRVLADSSTASRGSAPAAGASPRPTWHASPAPAPCRPSSLDKLYGNGFGGNAYTDHGRAREPEIARWVLGEHAIAPSCEALPRARRPRHLATPDGVAVRADGSVELAEIKTTAKAWRSIPRSYLRQVLWQQYVLGAERTLVVWEQHVDFVPVDDGAECRWVDRDDDEIHRLVALADTVLDTLARQAPVDPFAPGVRAYEPPPYDPLR